MLKDTGLYFLGLALEPYYRECYIRHTFIRQGGTSVVNCQGLLPWTHCHIACASPQLSSCPKSIGSCSILKIRFLTIQFKAALVWPSTFDCIKASIQGPSLQRLWSEATHNFIDVVVVCTTQVFVVILRSRLYLARWMALPLCLAFLYAQSHLFLRRFTEVLTQGRWRFP